MRWSGVSFIGRWQWSGGWNHPSSRPGTGPRFGEPVGGCHTLVVCLVGPVWLITPIYLVQ
jgi:hypothetical protein